LHHSFSVPHFLSDVGKKMTVQLYLRVITIQNEDKESMQPVAN
jgi:hypothetical protein